MNPKAVRDGAWVQPRPQECHHGCPPCQNFPECTVHSSPAKIRNISDLPRSWEEGSVAKATLWVGSCFVVGCCVLTLTLRLCAGKDMTFFILFSLLENCCNHYAKPIKGDVLKTSFGRKCPAREQHMSLGTTICIL